MQSIGEWIVGAALAFVAGFVAVFGLALVVIVALAPVAMALLPIGLLAMIARYMGWL